MTCSKCGGDGKVTCPTCDGAKRLLHYLRLDVSWKRHVSEKTLQGSDLPDELVGLAGSDVALQEEGAHLEPTSADAGGGPFRGGTMRLDATVNAAANELIASHAFPSPTKLRRQRLTVRRLPVLEGRYRWGKDVRRLWVLGTDHLVHAPGFPLSWLRIGAISSAAALLASGIVAWALIGS